MLRVVDWAVPGALLLGFVALFLTSPATLTVRGMVIFGAACSTALWWWFRGAIRRAHIIRLVRNGEAAELLAYLATEKDTSAHRLCKAVAYQQQGDDAAVSDAFASISCDAFIADRELGPLAVRLFVQRSVVSGRLAEARAWLARVQPRMTSGEASVVVAMCEAELAYATGDIARAQAKWQTVLRDIRTSPALRAQAQRALDASEPPASAALT